MFADTNRQLRKLSIYKPMQFQVTQIEFDFDDSASYDKEPGYFQSIIDETMSTTWEASDEDDLIEEITSASGWCVKSIDYVHVLKG
tara:strand:+ start:2022 stop:2279 length:258 start_codon:yes stop_codon:yes gene_type:complete